MRDRILVGIAVILGILFGCSAGAQTVGTPSQLKGTGVPSGGLCVAQNIGQEYFQTDATAGANVFKCTSAGTWTQNVPSTITWPYIVSGGLYYVATPTGAYAVTPPIAANWTSTNLGTATRTDWASGPITISGTTDSAWHMACTTVPSHPYTVRLTFIAGLTSAENIIRNAAIWRQSSDGKLSTIGITGGGLSEFYNWTNPTTSSSNIATNTMQQPALLYTWQLKDDSTNRLISLWNGAEAASLYVGTNWNQGRTAFLTADQICFGIWNSNSNFRPATTLVGYSVSQP